MVNNIKQKFLKSIISYIFLPILLMALISCSQFFNPKDSSTIDVAILLPITGEDEVLGRQYAQMVKMGLKNNSKINMKIQVYDSSTNDKLEQSLKEINSNRTDIIIGPIYSAKAMRVAEYIKGKNITMITLSNNPVLAEKNVFIFGHAPGRQTEAITNYFLKNNYKNYLLLLPKGQYSKTMSMILKDRITNKGATLARVEFYTNSPENINQAVKIISDAVDSLNEIDYNLTQPVVLISDDQKTLNSLFNSVKKYNLDKKAVIAGDNRIDIYFPGNIDIIFTGSLNIINTSVREEAANIGINHINFLHTIAYDAGNLVASYAGESYDRQTFLAKLNGKESFIGISGEFYFIDSIASRKYEVIKKEDGQYSTIVPK